MRPSQLQLSSKACTLIRLGSSLSSPSPILPLPRVLLGQASTISAAAQRRQQHRHLSTTARPQKLVAPNARTTDSRQNFPIANPIHSPDTMATPVNAQAVIDLIKNRRTYYALNKDLGAHLSAERVHEVVREAVLHVPSSFNGQPNRVVVLFGAEHDKLWDLTADALRPLVLPEAKRDDAAAQKAWEGTSQKLAGFKAAAGTVLYFEDEETIDAQRQAVPLYAHKFGEWATQSDAMLQFVVWTALEAEGLGASLQHYNPVIDAAVRTAWDLPPTWTLNAQMPFGGRAADTYPKTYKPIEERVKVFGA